MKEEISHLLAKKEIALIQRAGGKLICYARAARGAGHGFWLLAKKHGRGFLAAASSAMAEYCWDAMLPSQCSAAAAMLPFPLEGCC